MRACRKCGYQFDTPNCPECQRGYHAAWYAANRAKERAAQAAYHQANKEKIKAAVKQYREANIDVVKERVKLYAQERPEVRRAAAARWAANNRAARNLALHNYRAKKRAAGGTLTKGLARALHTRQHGLCAYCYTKLGTDYQLDHIVPVARNGANEDWNIQLLHTRCNQQKGDKLPREFMAGRGFYL